MQKIETTTAGCQERDSLFWPRICQKKEVTPRPGRRLLACHIATTPQCPGPSLSHSGLVMGWAPNESPPSSGPMAQPENSMNFLGLWKLDAEPFSAAKGHDECAVFGDQD